MKQLLSLFNLRPIERHLFDTLFYGGQMSASQLAKHAEISRTSAYDLLERITELGLVTETQKAGVKMFNTVSPEKIELLLKEKHNTLQTAQQELEYLKQAHQKKTKTQKPRLLLFEGRAELQQMWKDILLYRDITVNALWPIQQVFKLLTPQFMHEFHRERVQRNIHLRIIWPRNQITTVRKNPVLKPTEQQKREARIAPANIDFSLGYAIYGNTVRFLSSSQENFGFLVESNEFAATMLGQFEVIWNASKSYPPSKSTRLAKK